jgi:uncharacterized protein YcnI
MCTPAISRALIITAAASVLIAFACGVASAHVTVNAPGAARGGNAVLTFRVPNESATGSPTVALTAQFPALAVADTASIPGWKAAVSKDANKAVTAITWTADPGSGIGPGQFGEFAVWVEGLPDQPQLSLPAVQTYADGQVVKWDQQTKSGQPEPENPAPTLTLAARQSDNSGDANTTRASNTDSTARWLGIAGIVIGALGLGIGTRSILRRRA